MPRMSSETERGVQDSRVERCVLHLAAEQGSGFLRIDTPPLTAKVWTPQNPALLEIVYCILLFARQASALGFRDVDCEDNVGMRAVQFDAYGAPGVLHLRDAEQPQPEAGEVLVDVYAASLNPVDWKVRAGLVAANFPLTFPATTGRDGAGIVRGIGPDVDPALMDKRVALFAPRGQGTWTEQIALPAAGLRSLPD